MQPILLSLFLLVGISHAIWGQTIPFADLELQRYLVQEQCVDTTQNGISFSHDLNVDLNGDGVIQQQEALAVEALELYDFRDNYSIQSLADLRACLKIKMGSIYKRKRIV